MAVPVERIQALNAIETDIIACIESAGQALNELSKDKPNQKQEENHTQNFMRTLSLVENRLTEQINYMANTSTTQPHEGSSYGSQKTLQLAFHRVEYALKRVNAMEATKIRHAAEIVAGLSFAPPDTEYDLIMHNTEYIKLNKRP